MRYKALFFDLDGTLVDSRADLAEAVNIMLAALNLRPLEQQQIISAVGNGVKNLVTTCLSYANGDGIDIAEAMPIFIDYYTSHIADHTRPYTHVEETLARLEGIPKAVISNKLQGLSQKLLDLLDIGHYFDLVLGGDSLSEKKPSAEPVLYACKEFGVYPGEVLMVGDSTNDIRAAKAAGVDSAAVLYGLQPAEVLKKEQATHYLLSFGELLKIV